MGRQTVSGTCHLCGEDGKLSFEHVPPESGFNDRPLLLARAREILGASKLDQPHGRTQQRGAGKHTLCERCNNKTGHWYGAAFADWAYQAMHLLAFTDGRPSLYYQYRVFPLRVIKQIICMFFSANGPEFRRGYPELVRFVLDRDRRWMEPGIQILAFLSCSPRGRQSGVAARLRLSKGIGDEWSTSRCVLSEIAFPPMGYVLLLDSAPPDERLVDISFFADYRYNDWKEFSFRLPVLPIYTAYPGDYRSRDQVLRDAAEARGGRPL